MKERSVVLELEEDTKNFAFEIAAELRQEKALDRGFTLGLVGELGAGKTTFTRYLVKALGSIIPVSSPSYVLQHEYKAAEDLRIEHWDLYRLIGRSLELLPQELFDPPEQKSLRLIEWINAFPEIIKRADFVIELIVIGDTRRATIKAAPRQSDSH